MRSVASFIIFYVVVPAISAFSAVRAHVAAQPEPEMSTVGLEMLFVMVPFYLYAAGCVHFSYTNRMFLQFGMKEDFARRILIWDVPCQIWITASLLIERRVFGNYESSCILIFMAMTFLLPFIALIAAGLTYILVPGGVRSRIHLYRSAARQSFRRTDAAKCV